MSDDKDGYDAMLLRGLKALAVMAFFIVALLGFYAEVALTGVVNSTLGIAAPASGFTHIIAFVAYASSVVIAASYAAGES